MPPITDPRDAALIAVQAVRAGAPLTVPDAELKPEGRAMARRLAADTLRHWSRAGTALKPFLQRTPDAHTEALLRMATVELLAHGTPPHAAVSSAVSRAGRYRGLANAVLRRVSESGREVWDAAPTQRLPGWLRGRLSSAYGNARVQSIEAAHEAPVPLDLTARDDPAAFAEATGGTLLPTDTVRLARGQVTALPGYAEGAFWVQDAAAAMPARLLDAQPGERVLDLCAAPGGKTMQLAATGAQVTALDSDAGRLETLRQNLARTKLRAEVVHADALRYEAEPFDAILLDAPCSATGTIRRHPDLPFAKDGKGLKDLFRVQGRMLDHALTLLKPGGRLVFATCSLLPDEGERQIERVLGDWRTIGEAPAPRTPEGGFRTLPDLWPEEGHLDGFYFAKLERT